MHNLYFCMYYRLRMYMYLCISLSVFIYSAYLAACFNKVQFSLVQFKNRLLRRIKVAVKGVARICCQRWHETKRK